MGHDEIVSSSPTIVLLHGQPDSSASFWALRRALRARIAATVRIAVPDRPGYGANPLPATGYPGNAHWLTLWLRRFAPGPVLLVGHSWAGGVAALTAAADDPGLAGLVLMASIGPACLLWVDPLLAAPVLGEAIAYSVLGLGQRPVSRAAARILRSRLSDEDTPFALASGAAMSHRPLWRSFLVEQRALVRELPLITSALSEIAVPTTIITGTHDQVIPRRTVDALHGGIPHSSLVEIDGGHDLQLRQPEAAAESIAAAARAAFGIL